jgi:heme/copper-type cytochrome/quinol oxidase subunit 2
MIFSLFSSARFGKAIALNLEVLDRQLDIIRLVLVLVVVVVVVVVIAYRYFLFQRRNTDNLFIGIWP